jgi:hypothetical protein
MRPGDQLPLSRALILILLSTLLVTGSSLMAWLYFLHLREVRFNDDRYTIESIIQAGNQKRLPMRYLTELLQLSADRRVNLYQYSIKEAEKRLLASPLIHKVAIKKVLPGSLLIEYETRSPMFMIGNLTNTAIDQEGVLFPLRPFFSDLELVSLILPDQELHWGSNLESNQAFLLAKEIADLMNKISTKPYELKAIDLSRAWSKSYGKREIIITVEKAGTHKKHYCRINREHLRQSLINFQTMLQSEKVKDWLVIDFRLPQLAYLKKR